MTETSTAASLRKVGVVENVKGDTAKLFKRTLHLFNITVQTDNTHKM